MPVKRSIRMKKQPRVDKSKRTKSARAAWWTSKRSATGAVVGIAAAVMLIVLLRSPHGADPQHKAEMQIARAEIAMPTGSSAEPTAANDPTYTVPPVSAPVEPRADEAVARVTITGCLERSDESFRLTNTTGATAPTARSWKSAFLKKRPATIEVVDTVKRLNLRSHVGQRVTVTGTLVDREMRVGSLQRVASSCSSAPKVKA
jgi:hypothetical protein